MSVSVVRHDARRRPSLSPAAAQLSGALRRLFESRALDLPVPGSGATAQRFSKLMEVGQRDLSLARVVEAHTDAGAILAEAGRAPDPAALYGVWACDAPDSRLDLITDGTRLRLRGTKRYCSGATFLDRALVTAHCGESILLIDIALDTPDLVVDTSAWKSPAFAATDTSTVAFKELCVDRAQIVEGDRWYLQRPGFWHGAIAPAACWAGGAAALVVAARQSRCGGAHARAHLGALEAHAWGLQALLEQAGREVDSDPSDLNGAARHRALCARHLIERACMEVMDHFGRMTGPSLLAYDAGIATLHAELTLYIRQCHAERDLAFLAAPLPA